MQKPSTHSRLQLPRSDLVLHNTKEVHAISRRAIYIVYLLALNYESTAYSHN